MTVILIDPPAWPAHGRLWSHLASDTSVAELHAFAESQGLPERAFEGDHYDVPAERYEALVAAGAVPTAARELLAAIVAAGLRRPRRRGEQVVRSRVVDDYYPDAGRCRVDVIASALTVPPHASTTGWWLELRDTQLRVEPSEQGWRLPLLSMGDQRGLPVGYVRVRLLGQPDPGYRGPSPWVFRPVRRADPGAVSDGPGQWVEVRELAVALSASDVWPLIERTTLGT